MLRQLPFLLLLTAFFACESEEVYQLSTSETDFIRLQIGDQEFLMNARPAVSATSFSSSAGWEKLEVQRSTADNLHAIQLNLGDCDLKQASLPKSYATGNGTCGGSAQDVMIAYTTFAVGGSPTCPHLEGEPTQMEGSITIDSWGADDLVTGSFESDAMDGAGHRLKGTFQVYAY